MNANENVVFPPKRQGVINVEVFKCLWGRRLDNCSIWIALKSINKGEYLEQLAQASCI